MALLQKYSKATPAASNLLFIVLGLLLANAWNPILSRESVSRLQPIPIPEETTQKEAVFECERPAYVLRMLSYDPFVAHLENFITPTEAAHLKGLTEPRLNRSMVFDIATQKSMLSVQRTSSTAFLPRNDSIVKCIRARASEVQGYLYPDHMEVQATVYQPGQFYQPHHDCGGKERVVVNGTASGPLFRVSTIFGILDATCQDCGTSFPFLELDRTPLDDRICEFVDCTRDELTIKARPGSAVFWRNRFQDGSEDERMMHEGLPPGNGTKYGLNIWSHERTEERL